MSSACLLRVSAEGRLHLDQHVLPCTLGRAGIVPDKREGDGGTPPGRHPLREVFFRPDRLPPPATGLPRTALEPDMGWCDDPADGAYNRLIRRPFAASHESLWRDDGLYDLIVVLGYNDDPVEPGAGSAIFMHVASPEFGPTEGCVGLSLDNLHWLLGRCGPGSQLDVAP